MRSMFTKKFSLRNKYAYTLNFTILSLEEALFQALTFKGPSMPVILRVTISMQQGLPG